MAFYGCEFLFDGKSCKEYGLTLYNFGSVSQGDTSFPSAGRVYEDRTLSRYSSLFYGISQNDALEYTLVFGANPDSLDANEHLDRTEISAISAWLTGHNEQKWLEIVQPDMEAFRFKCIISELKLLHYGNMPWAFSCKVYCDSPFGYTFPESYKYRVEGSKEIVLFNRSTYNGYYKPIIRLTNISEDSFSIVNMTDGERAFSFSGLPSPATEITIDNEAMIITDDSGGLNLYPYFNYNFFRLKRGNNLLQIIGTADVEFICEFPVNIGG